MSAISTRRYSSERNAPPPRAIRQPRGRAHLAAEAVRTAQTTRNDNGAERARTWRFLGWFLSRVLALGVIVGGGWVVYDFASSDRYVVEAVHVTGNALLTPPEVLDIAAVQGVNVFWVNARMVEGRLANLPAVQAVEVAPALPGRVEISLQERQPWGLWHSGEGTYLVDRDGTVLMPYEPSRTPTFQPVALVSQAGGQAVRPGERINPDVLSASAWLAQRLPEIGIQPLAFEWSRAGGLEVPTQQGWRVRFDGSADLERQLSVLTTIRDHLSQTRASAELIDVRFRDRPFYR